MIHATMETLRKLGYLQVAAGSGWKCPMCAVYLDTTNDALGHQDHVHGTHREYVVPAGSQMWLYEPKNKSNPTAHSKEYTQVGGSGSTQSAKLVTYTEADVCKRPDGTPALGPMLMLFHLPPNSKRYEYVAFRTEHVEVREYAVQS